MSFGPGKPGKAEDEDDQAIARPPTGFAAGLPVRDKEQRLRELSGRAVAMQEAERRALSRELHDSAGQALTAIRITLEADELVVQDDDLAWNPESGQVRMGLHHHLGHLHLFGRPGSRLGDFVDHPDQLLVKARERGCVGTPLKEHAVLVPV